MTSTRIMVGPEHDITTAPYSDRHARRVELAHPVLMPRELQAFRHLGYLVRKRTCYIPKFPQHRSSSPRGPFDNSCARHRCNLLSSGAAPC